MSFTEVEFLYFLPAVWLLYWLLPRRSSVQNAVLLAASVVFYATWSVKLLALLLVGSLIDYSVTRQLGRPAGEQDRPNTRRLWLALSLLVNIGALGFFKYERFFATEADMLLQYVGLPPVFPVLEIALPLGISYYTLQRVGFVLDVYWRRQPPARSLLDFATFVAFFPQITAGPISRGSELMPQLTEPRRLLPSHLQAAAGAFLLGFLLKAWAADQIGRSLVDPIFAKPDEFTAAALWFGVVGYALQVFADFAGYSLMAIGVARAFAIELPVNFASPFLSRSLPEFWRRWHITLNRWLFDYVFTPATTGQGWLRGRFAVTMILVFLISGLWHGAAVTFLLWGLLHGVGMVVHSRWDDYYRGLCRKDRKFVALRKSAGYQLAAWFLTIGFFVLSLVPFRAPDLAVAVTIYQRLVPGHDGRMIDPSVFGVLAVLLIIGLHVLDLKPLDRVRSWFFALPPVVRGVAYGLVVAALMLAVPLTPSAFIYQQF